MNQQQPEQGFDLRSGFNFLSILASAHATCITPFIRHSFGRDAFGLPAVGSLVLIVLTMGKAPEMEFYLYAWLGAMVIQRSITFWKRNRGEHSRYSGWPWLAMKIPFVRSELKCKRGIEPLLCALVGGLLCPISETVGSFVFFGLFSIAFETGLSSCIQHARVRRLRDAEIEQRMLAAEVRGEIEDF